MVRKPSPATRASRGQRCRSRLRWLHLGGWLLWLALADVSAAAHGWQAAATDRSAPALLRHGASPAAGPTHPRIPPEADCVPIRSLAISGDAAEHYRWALRYVDRHDDPVSGRCVGPEGLHIALGRLQDVIAARGYVTTRVLLPSSPPTDGKLTFMVVPGRVGRVQFLPDLAPMATRDTVPLRRGALLNLRAIEQALADLRGGALASADIRVLPASQGDPVRGESDLLIVWQPLAAAAAAANSGAAARLPSARRFTQP